MSRIQLAKKYAKALYELGHQKGKAKHYLEQVDQVAAGIFKDRAIADFFLNSTVSHEAKRKTLEAVFQSVKVDEDVRGFLLLLVERSRIPVLPEIVRAGHGLMDQEEGTTRGKIKSANPISENLKAEYEKRVEAILKKKIHLETLIDEKIIGGVRVEVGGWTFDDSLQAHLGRMTDKLLNANI